MRLDTLRARTTSSRPGASRRSSMASSASVAGTPQSTANETRMNSVRIGSAERAPTNRIACGSEYPEASEMAREPKASGMATSSFLARSRRRRERIEQRTTRGAIANSTPHGDHAKKRPIAPAAKKANTKTPRRSSREYNARGRLPCHESSAISSTAPSTPGISLDLRTGPNDPKARHRMRSEDGLDPNPTADSPAAAASAIHTLKHTRTPLPADTRPSIARPPPEQSRQSALPPQ